MLDSIAKDVEMEFHDFVERHVAVIEPLERKSALAYWEASRTGGEEDFRRYSELKLELKKVYTDSQAFEYVKRVRESGDISDSQLARMADLIYLDYLGNQVDPELLGRIIELGALVEKKFSVFRAEVDGEKLTMNDVYDVLRKESDSMRRRRVWEASKRVGSIVSSDLLELVGLRNEAARSMGFDNYYEMSLILGEQSEDHMERLFSELDASTRGPFERIKDEIDAELAKQYGIEPEDIRPWHYHDPFFQEAPQTEEVDIDKHYKDRDVVELARRFFESIELPVDDIIARSDLYERDGKNPHAFCTDINRSGDVRILANIKNNAHWMDTILHELGHGAYDKYIDKTFPYVLRRYPHLCTTEASAMFFGRLAWDTAWMKASLALDDREVRRLAPLVGKYKRLKQLVFSRWCQTMFHFERALYGNPGQDLNSLWWEIVERCQCVKRPEGRNESDWASKIHIVTSPVYYHNYMLGELIASQFHRYVRAEVLGSEDREFGLFGKPEVGKYFRDVVYKPGAVLPWHDHIASVTGERLSPLHFVNQYVEEKD
jgi:peptidyl-dipeptidase A